MCRRKNRPAQGSVVLLDEIAEDACSRSISGHLKSHQDLKRLKLSRNSVCIPHKPMVRLSIIHADSICSVRVKDELKLPTSYIGI